MSDKEKKTPEEKEEVKEPEEKETNDQVKALKEEIESLRKKFEEAEKNFENSDKERETWKNRYYEAYADMSNVRKQLEKENADFKDHAVEAFIKELIPSLDAFDMALKKEPEDEQLKKYLEGFVMIHRKLLQVLKTNNVNVIAPQIGEEFNPTTMEAFSAIDGSEDNKIADTFLKGYELRGHLLRPAGVIITKKVEETTPSETKEDGKEEKTIEVKDGTNEENKEEKK